MLIIVTLRLIVQQSHLLTLVLSTLQAFYLYRLYAYGFDYLIILQRLIHAMLCFIYKSALFRNSNARTVNLFCDVPRLHLHHYYCCTIFFNELLILAFKFIALFIKTQCKGTNIS